MNEEENQKIKDLAKLCNITQGEVLRRMILEQPLCETPKENFFEVLNQLYSIHNDFKILSKFDESLEETLAEIEKFILNLQEHCQLGGESFGGNKPMGD